MEPLLQGFMWMCLMRCHARSAGCMGIATLLGLCLTL